MQICASPYKSSQILPQRPTIYGDGESLRSTPVVHFVGSRVRCAMFLNACSVALFQGRYTLCHNSVLSVLQRHLLKFWDYARQQPEHQQAPFIRFVPSVPEHLACLLSVAHVDLSRIKTPSAVLKTGSSCLIWARALSSLRRSQPRTNGQIS